MEKERLGVHAWIEAGVAVVLLLMAIGGTYMSTSNKVTGLEARVSYLETEVSDKDQRSYEIMTKLSVSVDRLNVNMARLEERLKATETKSN